MSVVFCEDVIKFPLKGDNMRMLGAVYEDPHAPALSCLDDPDDAGHRVDSFGWSVGTTFGVRLTAQGIRWGGVWSIGLVLTPRLATGQIGAIREGETVSSQAGVKDYTVEIGLAPGDWARAPVLGKRTLLAELGALALQHLGARQNWGWPEGAFAAVVQAFRQDEADVPWVAGTRANGLELPRDVFNRLSLEAWAGLNEAERNELVDAITHVLHAAGRPLQPLGVRPFGPKRDPLPVAQWRDAETGIPFSLICGGAFRPGYTREQIRQVHVYHEQSCSDEEIDVEFDFEGDEDDPVPRVNLRPDRTVKFVHPYGSHLPCDLSQKRSVAIPPLLLASEPLLWGARGLDGWLDRSKVRMYYSPKDGPEPNQDVLPVYLSWFEVASVLRHYGWSLPSSAEFEWALRAGRDALFYWGDEPPDVAPAGVTRVSSFEPEHPRVWPWCNRFGLSAPLMNRVWCLPLDGPNEGFPLVCRGGTDSWPGQDCGEWWLFASAVEARECLDDDWSLGCALRPAIRLRTGGRPRATRG
ncbi:MAG: hypothetical protein P4L84_24700 [Isosphaeraceae bacterium]|nr:hypothetical protein [Isosphaeraceae bacterium]